MLNNTDPDGYQPPPCFVDWPEGTFTGETKWTLGHCQNLVELFKAQLFTSLKEVLH